MTSQIRLEAGVKNAGDAISMISVADGALVEVGNMLCVNSRSGWQRHNNDDRSYLNSEYQNLVTEIERIADNTQWNGTNILNQASTSSSTFKYQVGANGGQTVSVNFGAVDQTSGSAFAVFGGSAASIAFTAVSAAVNAGEYSRTLTLLSPSNEQRATFGAAVNQLSYATDNLSNVKVNSEAARSGLKILITPRRPLAGAHADNPSGWCCDGSNRTATVLAL